MTRIHALCGHYSATYPDQDITMADVDVMHRARGFNGPGYHWGIRNAGMVEAGRSPETRQGAGASGFNRGVIHFCVFGGLDRRTGPNVGVDNRTREQKASQIALMQQIMARHPSITRVVGHRDVGSTQCPGYDLDFWFRKATGNNTQTSEPRPASTNAPTVTRPIKRRGSRGTEVAAIQEALKITGHYAGRVDGAFGPKTEAAVLAFQRDVGIDVDGVVGPMTWAEILHYGKAAA